VGQARGESSVVTAVGVVQRRGERVREERSEAEERSAAELHTGQTRDRERTDGEEEGEREIVGDRGGLRPLLSLRIAT
jgi:hypothetical protein